MSVKIFLMMINSFNNLPAASNDLLDIPNDFENNNFVDKDKPK